MSSVPSGVDVSSGWPLRRTRIKYDEEEGEDEVFFFFQSSKTTSVPIPGHIGYTFLSSQYWNLLSRCPKKKKKKTYFVDLEDTENRRDRSIVRKTNSIIPI